MSAHGWRGSKASDAGVRTVREHLRSLNGSAAQDEALIELIANGRFALLGEASHGTYDFYCERAAITRRLIVEHGYTAVAVEGDWPDAYRVNRYVRGASDDADAESALGGFKRFPTWMWRNDVVLDFVEWLREHNRDKPRERQAGFYGIDLYSLHSSIEAVLDYLDNTDAEAARRARDRYACFDHYGENTQAYGYAASFGLGETCEQAVVEQLVELTRKAGDDARRDGRGDSDGHFFAEQNARLVKNAEAYYRTMFRGHVSSWNLRDQHMVETVAALDDHLSHGTQRPRIALWAHNSHLGDARATEMGDRGEWNVGQLMRERYGEEATLVGFSTYTGSVTAASDWGSPPERKSVRPGLSGSFESLFHETAEDAFTLLLRGNESLRRALGTPRLQRAIGVIYLPQSERMSHYFDARLSEQFDAMIHIDRTRALQPLDAGPQWRTDEAPETYPSGV